VTDLRSMTRNAMDAVEDVNPANPDSPLSGAKGAAAGAALVVLPIAVERIVKFAGAKASDRMPSAGLSEKVSGLGESAAGKARQAVEQTTDKVTPDMPKPAGAAGGMLGKLFNRNGGESGKDSAAPGYGSGRRMPIQQSVDVAVPIRVAYDQWTQFEEWPKFMHRVDSVDQVDDSTVAFSTKVWGITKRFQANIEQQRPDERIEWDAAEGLSHTGVVTFHQLSDRLTRIEVTVDVEPDSLLEKAGRGMRHAKRAIRGDLHRFKAFVELNEDDVEGGWRGTIEDGEVKRRTERKPRPSGRSSGGSKRSGARSRSGGGASTRSRSRGSSGSGSKSRGRSSGGGSRRRTTRR
jgi:uncharacterized membrane protein